MIHSWYNKYGINYNGIDTTFIMVINYNEVTTIVFLINVINNKMYFRDYKG